LAENNLSQTNTCPNQIYVDDIYDKYESEPQWHVLWTRSNCEKLVYESLSVKGYELFLPEINQWTKGKSANHICRVPMFRGYLFLRHAMDKYSFIEISKTKGLVNVLGQRWDKLAVIPDQEIDTIQTAVGSLLPAFPHPYLREGDRVRITAGPLTNTEGILVKSDPTTGFLVLSIDLLKRSIAIQIDCTEVVPV